MTEAGTPPHDITKRWKYLYLLLSLLAFVVLNNIPGGGLLRRTILAAAIVAVLFASIRAAVIRPTHRMFVLGLGVTSALLDLASHVLPSRAVGMASASLGILFFGLVAMIIVRAVLAEQAVTADTIMGAFCVYLLIGATWTGAYVVIDIAQPGSLMFPDEIVSDRIGTSGLDRDGMYGYFSYVTLTTLGYGDIRPVGRVARMLAWMEAVLGQIFLATLVARLVGLHIATVGLGRPDGLGRRDGPARR